MKKNHSEKNTHVKIKSINLWWNATPHKKMELLVLKINLLTNEKKIGKK